MSLREIKARQRESWDSAPWEPMAARFTPIHDHVVARLVPRPGERWLDIGTGTGAVALRAARAGAQVTGVDLAPRMIETARWLASLEKLSIRFEVGDAESLDLEDESFDVVVSALGVFLAPDHAAAARELARVCRAGGRLGLVAWRSDHELERLHAPYWPERQPEAGDRRAWGRESYVAALLDHAYQLEFEEGELRLEAASGQEAWRLWINHDGPAKVLVDSVDRRRAERYRRAFVEHHERHRDGDVVSLTRRYLLTIGRRRS
jgi:SAM-dependent methyltransferase